MVNSWEKKLNHFLLKIYCIFQICTKKIWCHRQNFHKFREKNFIDLIAERHKEWNISRLQPEASLFDQPSWEWKHGHVSFSWNSSPLSSCYTDYSKCQLLWEPSLGRWVLQGGIDSLLKLSKLQEKAPYVSKPGWCNEDKPCPFLFNSQSFHFRPWVFKCADLSWKLTW